MRSYGTVISRKPEIGEPKRLTLLYQLYLTNQASRRFMRLALAGKPLTGEAFAVLSYLHANGPRTLSQAARDLGLPVTSLATTLTPLVDADRIERVPHPRDRRARLLTLTDQGRGDLSATIPAFSHAYTMVVERLRADGVDIEALFTAIETIRTEIERTSDLLEERAADGARTAAQG
jgi:DNA-binding MarR family transcriptional regulator